MANRETLDDVDRDSLGGLGGLFGGGIDFDLGGCGKWLSCVGGVLATSLIAVLVMAAVMGGTEGEQFVPPEGEFPPDYLIPTFTFPTFVIPTPFGGN